MLPSSSALIIASNFSSIIAYKSPIISKVLSDCELDYVVVVEGVLARPEVPGLVLRVVGPALQALQLVLEVQNVVSLLDAQSFVLHTRNEKSFET